ncbi:hypothetical protein ACJX0J_038652, partial [Zea mays]
IIFTFLNTDFGWMISILRLRDIYLRIFIGDPMLGKIKPKGLENGLITKVVLREQRRARTLHWVSLVSRSKVDLQICIVCFYREILSRPIIGTLFDEDL